MNIIRQANAYIEANAKLLRTIILFSAFLVTLLVSYIQPPFQTPDEFNHLKRAYLLSKGNVFLGSQDGKTGGGIDTGLLDYMDQFNALPFHPDVKYTKEIESVSSNFRWTGNERFSELPNTAVYFPAIYLPQSIVIKVTSAIGLSIHTSYQVLKLSCIIVTFLLLLAAARIGQISDFGIGIILLPMSLALIGSTHPEPFSYGLILIIASLFIREFRQQKISNIKTCYLYVLSIAVLASYRFNMFAIFIMPIALAWKQKNYNLARVTAFAMFLVLTWIFYVSKSVIGFQGWVNATQQSVLGNSADPSRIVSLLYNTLTNPNVLENYLNTFIGTIGWLDSPLTSIQYFTIIGLLLIVLLTSARDFVFKIKFAYEYLVLYSAVVFSMLSLLLILIFTTTSPNSSIIEGMQGRYFIPILLILAVLPTRSSNCYVMIRHTALLLLLLCASVFTITNLIGRYYTTSAWGFSNNTIIGNLNSNTNYGMLTSGRSFEQPFIPASDILVAARFKLATYMRENKGILTIEIVDDKNNIIFNKEYDMSLIKDNDWFPVQFNKLKLGGGAQYRVRMTGQPEDNAHSVTWWGKNETGSHNYMIIDGDSKDGTFAYQLMFNTIK